MIGVPIGLTHKLNMINTNADNTSFKPEIVCPKKKHITFVNEHNCQNIKNFITADIECCIVEVSTNDLKYVIAEHIPIAVGYTWQGNFKHYFGLGCIKRFARDLLEIETENNFKHNEKMIFTEDKYIMKLIILVISAAKHVLIK